MNYSPQTDDRDQALIADLKDFVPAEVFDIHAHLHAPRFFPGGAWPALARLPDLGCRAHREAMERTLPARMIGGLYFPLPHANAERAGVNAWVCREVKEAGGTLSRALALAAPGDDPALLAAQLATRQICGFKVYHCYAPQSPSVEASLGDYAPEWMWQLLDQHDGILMLHVVRAAAMADRDNQRNLTRLCGRYPRVRVVLAHIGRSFNHRHAREGLRAVAPLDNVWVDTSVICDAEAFTAALTILGPRRVLWGSDHPVSEFRGRCITVGSGFHWLYAGEQAEPAAGDFTALATLIGIESLAALREACRQVGLNRTECTDLFRDNALRLLAPFLPPAAIPPPTDGPILWQAARRVIAGGTGLLSKRAEQFDPATWPAYFSRCAGCEVWDLNGRRYADLAGGIGAVFLGYADPDVTRAVRRRLTQGTYCTLANPDEIALAERLLALHPWAGKVRYARGGGEAMAMAVRIARAATGRSGVAFCGYHGWHDWYLAANLGETSALDGHLLPGLEPRGVPAELRGTTVPFRYNDLPSFEAALAKLGGNLAAVVMEPFRSQLPQDGFLAQVARRCRAAGAVFVADEVTSGLRYGFPGALARLGVEPDLAVYAKAYSNGFPFGAVVGRSAPMDAAEQSFISSSYWTDGVGTAAALAVLTKVEDGKVHEAVWAKGAALQAGLQRIAAAHPQCRVIVGGMPATPTLRFDLGENAAAAQVIYVRKMLERGFLASTYCYLMDAHGVPVLEKFQQAFAEVLGALSGHLARGDLSDAAGAIQGPRGFARLA